MKAVVFAAGESSRMWPFCVDKHKAMYDFLGKPLLYYTLIELKNSGISEVIIIISDKDKTIPNYFEKGNSVGLKITYFVQKKPLGMGNALLGVSKNLSGDFIALHASQANCSSIIRRMIDKKKNFVLAARKTDSPQDFGILKFKGSKIVEVVEKPKKFIGDKKVVGVYLLPQKFLTVLKSIKEHQYSFEDALSKLVLSSSPECVIVDDLEEITLKYPWHILLINKSLLVENLKTHKISLSSKIHKSVLLEGNVYIGENVRIFENAVIKGPCYIGDNSVIGNSVLIRDHSYIGKNVQIGHNSEIKNSVIYDNTHLDNAVILDSVIDEGARIGSGMITANRRLDRKNVKSIIKGENVDSLLGFLGAFFGKNVAIGIHAGTMPGVKVGANSVVGPGTILFKDLKENSKFFHKFESPDGD